jgi:hypothetical protein
MKIHPLPPARTAAKHAGILLVILLLVTLVTVCSKRPGGRPFPESGPQKIPGRIQCEFYDLGGEGIAYYDADSVNNGSGKLNPADGTVLHEFRMHEGVDISYTKPNGIDDNGYNLVNPELGSLYVGWTEPGEWMNYTVEVAESGKYKIGLMLTSNRGGTIAFSVNGKDATGPLAVRSTFVAADTVGWRQWHHWNYQDGLTELRLDKGIHLLTLHTITEGNMNFDFLDFSSVN